MNDSCWLLKWMTIYGVVNILVHYSNHHISKSQIQNEILFLQSFLPLLIYYVYYFFMSNRKSFFPSWNRTIAYGPVAVFHAGSLYSMFQALKYCSFRTVGVGRFIAPILTSLYEVFVLQSVRWSKIQFLYLVGTFMGAVLSFRDVEFYGNILSIPWITTSVVCTAGGTIYAKHLLQYKICPTQASYLENLYCSVFFLLQSFWSVPYGWKQQSWKDSVSLPWITKATFFVSVFTGYLITLSRQHLRKALGPTKFLVFVGLIRINSLFLVSKLLLKSLSWSGLTGVGLIVGCSIKYLIHQDIKCSPSGNSKDVAISSP